MAKQQTIKHHVHVCTVPDIIKFTFYHFTSIHWSTLYIIWMYYTVLYLGTNVKGIQILLKYKVYSTIVSGVETGQCKSIECPINGNWAVHKVYRE